MAAKGRNTAWLSTACSLAISITRASSSQPLVSATHDFDLDAATTTMFERYLNEVAEPPKVAAVGGASEPL
jgi:hypothetical protein